MKKMHLECFTHSACNILSAQLNNALSYDDSDDEALCQSSGLGPEEGVSLLELQRTDISSSQRKKELSIST